MVVLSRQALAALHLTALRRNEESAGRQDFINDGKGKRKDEKLGCLELVLADYAFFDCCLPASYGLTDWF